MSKNDMRDVGAKMTRAATDEFQHAVSPCSLLIWVAGDGDATEEEGHGKLAKGSACQGRILEGTAIVFKERNDFFEDFRCSPQPTYAAPASEDWDQI